MGKPSNEDLYVQWAKDINAEIASLIDEGSVSTSDLITLRDAIWAANKIIQDAIEKIAGYPMGETSQ
jgi:hypothetical protein